MSNFELSRHAHEQLAHRGIEEKLVEEILQSPLGTVEEDGLTVYYAVIKEKNQDYLVRIFVNHQKIPPLVVTGYKTSKIKKYLP